MKYEDTWRWSNPPSIPSGMSSPRRAVVAPRNETSARSRGDVMETVTPVFSPASRTTRETSMPADRIVSRQ